MCRGARRVVGRSDVTRIRAAAAAAAAAASWHVVGPTDRDGDVVVVGCGSLLMDCT